MKLSHLHLQHFIILKLKNVDLFVVFDNTNPSLPLSANSRFSRLMVSCWFLMIRSLKRVYSSYKNISFVFKNFNFPKQSFSKSVVNRFTMEPIDIDQLRANVTKQGGIVRQLKKDGAPQEEVTAGIF